MFSLDTVCLCSCLDMWVWYPHRADYNFQKHFWEDTTNLLETVSQSQTAIGVSSETSLVQVTLEQNIWRNKSKGRNVYFDS